MHNVKVSQNELSNIRNNANPKPANTDSEHIYSDSNAPTDELARIYGIDKHGGVNGVESHFSGTNDDLPPDPFCDLDKLRIADGMHEQCGTKVMARLECRKPGSQEYVRANDDVNYSIDALIIENKESREYYMVDPSLEKIVTQEAFRARIITAVNRNGDLFLWVVKLRGLDGRSNSWNESALAASENAKKKWTRIIANMRSNSYDILEVPVPDIEPEWPDVPFNKMLRLCFRDRFIDSWDHILLKKLRGEI